MSSQGVAPLNPGPYQIVAFARSAVSQTFNNAYVVTVSIPTPNPIMVVDTPGNGWAVGTTFIVAGWAIDTASPTGTGIDAVHVWAFPSVGGQIPVGVATYGVARPDIGDIFGAPFTNSGWSLSGSLPVGTYTLAAYPHDTVLNAFMAPVMVFVTVQ
jgi:hypothetical protein